MLVPPSGARVDAESMDGGIGEGIGHKAGAVCLRLQSASVDREYSLYYSRITAIRTQQAAVGLVLLAILAEIAAASMGWSWSSRDIHRIDQGGILPGRWSDTYLMAAVVSFIGLNLVLIIQYSYRIWVHYGQWIVAGFMFLYICGATLHCIPRVTPVGFNVWTGWQIGVACVTVIISVLLPARTLETMVGISAGQLAGLVWIFATVRGESTDAWRPIGIAFVPVLVIYLVVRFREQTTLRLFLHQRLLRREGRFVRLQLTNPVAPIVESVRRAWGPSQATELTDWLIYPDELRVGKVLGRGLESVVYDGELYGFPVAIKRHHRGLITEDQVRRFVQTMRVVTQLRHKHVCRIIGASFIAKATTNLGRKARQANGFGAAEGMMAASENAQGATIPLPLDNGVRGSHGRFLAPRLGGVGPSPSQELESNSAAKFLVARQAAAIPWEALAALRRAASHATDAQLLEVALQRPVVLVMDRRSGGSLAQLIQNTTTVVVDDGAEDELPLTIRPTTAGEDPVTTVPSSPVMHGHAGAGGARLMTGTTSSSAKPVGSIGLNSPGYTPFGASPSSSRAATAGPLLPAALPTSVAVMTPTASASGKGVELQTEASLSRPRGDAVDVVDPSPPSPAPSPARRLSTAAGGPIRPALRARRSSIGGLAERQRVRTRLPWSLRLRILAQVAEGMAYLHSFEPPILHADLRASNVLLDETLTASISDFLLPGFVSFREWQDEWSRRPGGVVPPTPVAARAPSSIGRLGSLRSQASSILREPKSSQQPQPPTRRSFVTPGAAEQPSTNVARPLERAQSARVMVRAGDKHRGVADSTLGDTHRSTVAPPLARAPSMGWLAGWFSTSRPVHKMLGASGLGPAGGPSSQMPSAVGGGGDSSALLHTARRSGSSALLPEQSGGVAPSGTSAWPAHGSTGGGGIRASSRQELSGSLAPSRSTAGTSSSSNTTNITSRRAARARTPDSSGGLESKPFVQQATESSSDSQGAPAADGVTSRRVGPAGRSDSGTPSDRPPETPPQPGSHVSSRSTNTTGPTRSTAAPPVAAVASPRAQHLVMTNASEDDSSMIPRVDRVTRQQLPEQTASADESPVTRVQDATHAALNAQRASSAALGSTSHATATDVTETSRLAPPRPKTASHAPTPSISTNHATADAPSSDSDGPSKPQGLMSWLMGNLRSPARQINTRIPARGQEAPSTLGRSATSSRLAVSAAAKAQTSSMIYTGLGNRSSKRAEQVRAEPLTASRQASIQGMPTSSVMGAPAQSVASIPDKSELYVTAAMERVSRLPPLVVDERGDRTKRSTDSQSGSRAAAGAAAEQTSGDDGLAAGAALHGVQDSFIAAPSPTFSRSVQPPTLADIARRGAARNASSARRRASVSSDPLQFTGSPGWMAPELFSAEAAITEKIDVYSFAMLCYEVATGLPPFVGMSLAHIGYAVAVEGKRPTFPRPLHGEMGVPTDLEALITRCWSTEPTARPAFAEIIAELAIIRDQYDRSPQKQHEELRMELGADEALVAALALNAASSPTARAHQPLPSLALGGDAVLSLGTTTTPGTSNNALASQALTTLLGGGMGGGSVASPGAMMMNRGAPQPAIINSDDMALVKKLGSGAYGDVYLAKFLGTQVAVKIFDFTKKIDTMVRVFRKEAGILSLMRHPNVLAFVGVCCDISLTAIVTEYCEQGSLRELLSILRHQRTSLGDRARSKRDLLPATPVLRGASMKRRETEGRSALQVPGRAVAADATRESPSSADLRDKWTGRPGTNTDSAVAIIVRQPSQPMPEPSDPVRPAALAEQGVAPVIDTGLPGQSAPGGGASSGPGIASPATSQRRRLHVQVAPPLLANESHGQLPTTATAGQQRGDGVISPLASDAPSAWQAGGTSVVPVNRPPRVRSASGGQLSAASDASHRASLTNRTPSAVGIVDVDDDEDDDGDDDGGVRSYDEDEHAVGVASTGRAGSQVSGGRPSSTQPIENRGPNRASDASIDQASAREQVHRTSSDRSTRSDRSEVADDGGGRGARPSSRNQRHPLAEDRGQAIHGDEGIQAPSERRMSNRASSGGGATGLSALSSAAGSVRSSSNRSVSLHAADSRASLHQTTSKLRVIQEDGAEVSGPKPLPSPSDSEQEPRQDDGSRNPHAGGEKRPLAAVPAALLPALGEAPTLQRRPTTGTEASSQVRRGLAIAPARSVRSMALDSPAASTTPSAALVHLHAADAWAELDAKSTLRVARTQSRSGPESASSSRYDLRTASLGSKAASLSSTALFGLKHRLELLAGVARGLLYMHSFRFPLVHRDLKTDNILLTQAWTPRIADFGFTRVVDPNVDMTRCGTLSYTAPEILEGRRYDGSIDVFSFAIVANEVISGQKPYYDWRDRLVDGDAGATASTRDRDRGVDMPSHASKGESDRRPVKELLIAIVHRGFRPTLEVWRDLLHCEDEFITERAGKEPDLPPVPVAWRIEATQELISTCWASDPRQRPSFSAIAAVLDALQQPTPTRLKELHGDATPSSWIQLMLKRSDGAARRGLVAPMSPPPASHPALAERGASRSSAPTGAVAPSASDSVSTSRAAAPELGGRRTGPSAESKGPPPPPRAPSTDLVRGKSSLRVPIRAAGASGSDSDATPASSQLRRSASGQASDSEGGTSGRSVSTDSASLARAPHSLAGAGAVDDESMQGETIRLHGRDDAVSVAASQSGLLGHRTGSTETAGFLPDHQSPPSSAGALSGGGNQPDATDSPAQSSDGDASLQPLALGIGQKTLNSRASSSPTLSKVRGAGRPAVPVQPRRARSDLSAHERDEAIVAGNVTLASGSSVGGGPDSSGARGSALQSLMARYAPNDSTRLIREGRRVASNLMRATNADDVRRQSRTESVGASSAGAVPDESGSSGSGPGASAPPPQVTIPRDLTANGDTLTEAANATPGVTPTGRSGSDDSSPVPSLQPAADDGTSGRSKSRISSDTGTNPLSSSVAMTARTIADLEAIDGMRGSLSGERLARRGMMLIECRLVANPSISYPGEVLAFASLVHAILTACLPDACARAAGESTAAAFATGVDARAVSGEDGQGSSSRAWLSRVAESTLVAMPERIQDALASMARVAPRDTTARDAAERDPRSSAPGDGSMAASSALLTGVLSDPSSFEGLQSPSRDVSVSDHDAALVSEASEASLVTPKASGHGHWQQAPRDSAGAAHPVRPRRMSSLTVVPLRAFCSQGGLSVFDTPSLSVGGPGVELAAVAGVDGLLLLPSVLPSRDPPVALVAAEAMIAVPVIASWLLLAYDCVRWSPHVGLLASVLLGRMVKIARKHFVPTPVNWRRLVFACMWLAQRIINGEPIRRVTSATSPTRALVAQLLGIGLDNVQERFPPATRMSVGSQATTGIASAIDPEDSGPAPSAAAVASGVAVASRTRRAMTTVTAGPGTARFGSVTTAAPITSGRSRRPSAAPLSAEEFVVRKLVTALVQQLRYHIHADTDTVRQFADEFGALVSETSARVMRDGDGSQLDPTSFQLPPLRVQDQLVIEQRSMQCQVRTARLAGARLPSSSKPGPSGGGRLPISSGSSETYASGEMASFGASMFLGPISEDAGDPQQGARRALPADSQSSEGDDDGETPAHGPAEHHHPAVRDTTAATPTRDSSASL